MNTLIVSPFNLSALSIKEDDTPTGRVRLVRQGEELRVQCERVATESYWTDAPVLPMNMYRPEIVLCCQE